MATFENGQSVIVSPPMTPLARHPGTIVRPGKHGWRVRFNAWGMILTETIPANCISEA